MWLWEGPDSAGVMYGAGHTCAMRRMVFPGATFLCYSCSGCSKAGGTAFSSQLTRLPATSSALDCGVCVGIHVTGSTADPACCTLKSAPTACLYNSEQVHCLRARDASYCGESKRRITAMASVLICERRPFPPSEGSPQRQGHRSTPRFHSGTPLISNRTRIRVDGRCSSPIALRRSQEQCRLRRALIPVHSTTPRFRCHIALLLQ